MHSKIKKVVIPVAGLGTRGLPYTKEVPKELLPILTTPSLQFIVEEVIEAGVEQVVFITSKGKSALEDYFDHSPYLEEWLRKRGKNQLADKVKKVGSLCEVISVRQKEPLGLGHAVLCAEPVIGKETFALCLGDEVFPPWGNSPKRGIGRLVEESAGGKNSVVGVMEVPLENTSSYGIVDVQGLSLGKTAKVKKTVEKPKPENSPSRWALVGRYVFQPDLFDCLKNIKPGQGGELQLTDAMDLLARQGTLDAFALEGPRYDVGNLLHFVIVQIEAAMRNDELKKPLVEYIENKFLNKK
jgi:UTP--glucose-1-phosphate uridylyltransferase